MTWYLTIPENYDSESSSRIRSHLDFCGLGYKVAVEGEFDVPTFFNGLLSLVGERSILCTIQKRAA